MDVELTKKFQTILKKQGFKFSMKRKVTKSEVAADGSGVTLTTEASKGGKEQEDKYDVVLVATGRRPYTDALGLENLGIQTDQLGRIEVDHCQFAESFWTERNSVLARKGKGW